MGAIEARIARPAAVTLRQTASAYLSLTKPRIISLLLITTIPAMILAAEGWPSTWLVVTTVIGGTLAAGGANAINCYVDRDIDQLMHRTQGRPLPLGLIDPGAALAFGLALEAAAFSLLVATSNLLAATLALSATAFYVFVYTLWLKRTSRQNIVIGGAAGAVPPLVGWAAVSGEMSIASIVLFAIVFVWTPPHFWALSIKYRDDYARARVPMLPVVGTLEETKAQILLYTVGLLPVSLALIPAASMSWLYGGAAVLLWAGFAAAAWRLKSDAPGSSPMQVFRYSIVYLALLFVAMAADQLMLG
jgi:protoheme IX farnesyltransferase